MIITHTGAGPADWPDVFGLPDFGIPLPRAGSAPGADLERDLERTIAALAPGETLSVVLVGLDGFEALTRSHGRRWADRQLHAVAAALRGFAGEQRLLGPYRLGALTFATVAPTELDEACAIAAAMWRRVDRISAELTVNLGVADLDPAHCADALSLVIAAEAALDQARALATAGGDGLIIAAAESGSGARWLATRATTRLSLSA